MVAAGVVALLASVPAASAATPGQSPGEHEVKAAFLYHFAHLVEWPALAPDEPMIVAVVGADPFGPALEQALAGKAVRSRPLRLQRFRGPALVDGTRVHVLFVGGGDDVFTARALAAVAGQPVLTVGEAPRFAERGGMIGFRVTPEGRVAFDINLARAENAGLRLSSQLLKLARIVGEAR